MKKILKQLISITPALILFISLIDIPAMAGSAAKIGPGDLKIKIGKVEINVLNETKKTFIRKIKNGSWGADGVYTWENGEAEFSNDSLIRVALKSRFTTPRGISDGSPLKKFLKTYPAADQTENSDEGTAYYYKGTTDKGSFAMAFAVSAETQKVLYAIIQINRNAVEGDTVSEESLPPLKEPLSYYDGYTWGSADGDEQLKLCKTIAILFKNAGYGKLIGEEQAMCRVITRFYNDNGGDHGEFQKGPVDIIIKKFRITDKAAIKKVKQQ